MYDINSASAIHLELIADIPRELADKIVVYRKKRKLCTPIPGTILLVA
jgi:DNA uptake protein ComE-like DNA-binding protein